MKTLLPVLLLAFSVSVSADDGCGSLLQEWGITPAVQGQATMRKITLEGKTKDDVVCQVKFLPDYCTFELNAPLDVPEMYYLQDTSYSSIKITYSDSNRFSFKAVTKETTDDWGQVTKILRIEREKKVGYELEYKLKEGRFFKNDAKSFKCTVNVVRNS
jgi:hypothetical protein